MKSIIFLALFVILSSPTTIAQFKCPERTGFFPDPVQCDLYYVCSKGEFEAKLCPDGLVFDPRDPNHERCDIPANVDCDDRTELQEPQPTPGCPRANGYYRHSDPRACDKFFNCVNGVPHELPCPPGLIYDDVASTCAWPADSHRKDCKDVKRDTLDDGFSCPNEDVQGPGGRKLPHPTFAHPDDCRKFYICRNGVMPQKGYCPKGLVYNEDTFDCDDPKNVSGCENYYDGQNEKSKTAKKA